MCRKSQSSFYLYYKLGLIAKHFIKTAIIKVIYHCSVYIIGPTLCIMFAKEEPNCFFGGMAAPSWLSDKNGKFANDEGEGSWLFKIETENNNN